jgi:class 3 adenylate cyclase
MLWAAVLVTALVALVLQRRTASRAAHALGARLEAAGRELESLQQAFSRFAPAAVVEDIIAQGISTRSEKKEVTILFADVKGFTALGEVLEPAVLVTVLNGYLSRMSRAIISHGGHVAKFIGDGILALFGALEPNPWQTNDAVRAALAMRAALADYNEELAADGLPALAVGIGIHRGVVVTGVMGSAELIEYGVIGSVVNVASRVERLTRTHDVDVLVSDAAREALDKRFRLRAMPGVEVKGVAAPLVTFAVEGFAEG